MKCLILCMCCNNPYYLQQWEDIKNTWGKHIIDGEYPDIDIMMFTSSGTDMYGYNENDKILYVPANDSLSGTFEKTSQAIHLLNMFNIKYDCILRTNCSTIINLSLLDKFLKSELYNPNKVYAGEIYLGGWKSAPYNNSFTFRGNFVLLSKKYINLINNDGCEMAKQINNYDRAVHKDMFKVDDITMSAIINTYIETNKLNSADVYERIPIQYLNKIYSREENVYGNTMAFFIKTFSDNRAIKEYYKENSLNLKHFNDNFYKSLSDDLKLLEDDMRSSRYVEKHIPINDKEANIYRIPFEEVNVKEK